MRAHLFLSIVCIISCCAQEYQSTIPTGSIILDNNNNNVHRPRRSETAAQLAQMHALPITQPDININNIWDGKWYLKNKDKYSTFFPTSWDEYKIADKAMEALRNITKINVLQGGIKFEGITSENITLEFFLNNNGTIDTFYPLLKGSQCKL